MSFRGRRILKQMAGLSLTPFERVLVRQARRVVRAEAIGREQLALLDLIQRRERGEEGTKPMPFAKKDEEAQD